ncbi:serine hydrolase domain-containing protein [Hephaestia sp. GCM10023244]
MLWTGALWLVAATMVPAATTDAPAPASSTPAVPAAETERPALPWTLDEQVRMFKAMEDQLPSRVVKRGETVHALANGTPIAPRWRQGERELTIEKWMDEYRSSGVIILRDGKIVYERYALGRKPDERWTSFSVAKSVAGLLAGAAIRDGKLALGDQVTRFMPELVGSAYDGVTVENILTMSSGVRWYEDYVDGVSDLALTHAISARGGDFVVEHLAKLERAHEPGTTWHYNTAESHLLGMVVSRAVGMTLSDYLSEKIWKPYGMEQDAAWLIDGKGRESAGCCLSMTLRDYARLGQFVLDGGIVDGAPVMEAQYLADATSVRIANDQPAPSGYGYQWWIGARAFEASGIFGQSILVYPKERLVIAVNSAWPAPIGDDLFAALSLFYGAVHDAAAPDFAPVLKPANRAATAP